MGDETKNMLTKAEKKRKKKGVPSYSGIENPNPNLRVGLNIPNRNISVSGTTKKGLTLGASVSPRSGNVSVAIPIRRKKSQ